MKDSNPVLQQKGELQHEENSELNALFGIRSMLRSRIDKIRQKYLRSIVVFPDPRGTRRAKQVATEKKSYFCS